MARRSEQYLLFVASHPRSGTHLCLDTLASCVSCNVCMYSWEFFEGGGWSVKLFKGDPAKTGTTLFLVKTHALPHQVNWSMFNINETGFTPFMRAMRLGTCYVSRNLHDTLVSCWRYYTLPHVAAKFGYRPGLAADLLAFLQEPLPVALTVPYGLRNRVSGHVIANIVDRVIAHRMAWEAAGSRQVTEYAALVTRNSVVRTPAWLAKMGLMRVARHDLDQVEPVGLHAGTAVEPWQGQTGAAIAHFRKEHIDFVASRVERAGFPLAADRSDENARLQTGRKP